MLNNFNPDLKVEIKEGKFFNCSDEQLSDIKQLQGVAHISKTLEEVAFYEYEGTTKVGIIKGVDQAFAQVTTIDSAMNRGQFILKKGKINYGILGSGLYYNLSASLNDRITPIKVYMPYKKKKKSLPGKDFKSMLIYPSGTFAVQSEADNQYVVASYDFVNKLMDADGQVSALEIKLSDIASVSDVRKNIQNILGEDYSVKDRYQMDEAFLKLMNIEKWISFLIISLTLLLVAFNLVGALWMIVLDKRKDISILKAMGIQEHDLKRIFLYQGTMICLIGLFIGTSLSVIFYFLQKTFGLIPIPHGFIIDSYPMQLEFFDVIIVCITVIVIGYLASLLPASKAAKIEQSIRT